MTQCPMCGQQLADPEAAARARRNLEKLQAEARSQAEKETEKAVRAAVEAATEEATQKARKQDQQVDALQKQVGEMQRRMERMTADERGEIRESEILDKLRKAFPEDKIERLDKTRGSADIRHEVRERGKACGVIVYECKNVSKWANAYVEQARTSRAHHRAAHAIVVSNVFPKAEKHLCFVRDVAVVHPAVVAGVARLLRQEMAIRASATGTAGERERRADTLLRYVKGSDFKACITEAADAVVDLRNFQSKERQAHDRVWEEQRIRFEKIEASHARLQTRIEAIVEGTNIGVLPEVAAAG